MQVRLPAPIADALSEEVVHLVQNGVNDSLAESIDDLRNLRFGIADRAYLRAPDLPEQEPPDFEVDREVILSSGSVQVSHPIAIRPLRFQDSFDAKSDFHQVIRRIRVDADEPFLQYPSAITSRRKIG
jgi:hypothetical protein